MLRHFLFFVAASARVMDRLAAVPKGWKEVGRAAPDETVFLRVALKQQHAAALEQAVLEMSTPGHPNYGMHMTRDEVRAYTAPSDAATSAVTTWLREHGIQEPLVDNDLVSFTATVRTANELLEADFGWYQYQYAQGDGPKLRTLEYSVPDEIAAHVDLVQPTTRFGQLGVRKSTIFDTVRLEPVDAATPVTKGTFATAVDATEVCENSVTPDCLKSLYNINYTASAGPEHKIAFNSFLEEYARYKDLEEFVERYVPAAKGQNFSVELVNGGLNDQNSRDDSCENYPRYPSWKL
jgi:tripeptidyl-peptidase-1